MRNTVAGEDSCEVDRRNANLLSSGTESLVTGSPLRARRSPYRAIDIAIELNLVRATFRGDRALNQRKPPVGSFPAELFSTQRSQDRVRFKADHAEPLREVELRILALVEADVEDEVGMLHFGLVDSGIIFANKRTVGSSASHPRYQPRFYPV